MARTQTVQDYDPVHEGFPVERSWFTPLESGEFLTDTRLSMGEKACMLCLRVGARSVGATIPRADRVSYAIPVNWSGDFYINGEQASRTRIYLCASPLYIHGDQRTTIGITLDREDLVKTIGALKGTGPERLAPQAPDLEFEQWFLDRLRARLLTTMVRYRNGGGSQNQSFFDRTVFELMMDAHLRAHDARAKKASRARRPEHVVRKVEEAYVAAGTKPLSLADLCDAAGVSKSALYVAFQKVCGTSPLAYLHKRQLTRARRRLLRYDPGRGMVKRAALGVGLTELGRFSVEYRLLFGESPAVTLQSSSPADRPVAD